MTDWQVAPLASLYDVLLAAYPGVACYCRLGADRTIVTFRLGRREIEVDYEALLLTPTAVLAAELRAQPRIRRQSAAKLIDQPQPGAGAP